MHGIVIPLFCVIVRQIIRRSDRSPNYRHRHTHRHRAHVSRAVCNIWKLCLLANQSAYMSSAHTSRSRSAHMQLRWCCGCADATMCDLFLCYKTILKTNKQKVMQLRAHMRTAYGIREIFPQIHANRFDYVTLNGLFYLRCAAGDAGAKSWAACGTVAALRRAAAAAPPAPGSPAGRAVERVWRASLGWPRACRTSARRRLCAAAPVRHNLQSSANKRISTFSSSMTL